MTDSSSAQRGTLQQALERWNIPLADTPQRQRVEKYCEVLWRENDSLNLTRHLTFDVFVARDLTDVLQLSRLIRPEATVLDIGSGGGVPGILLAILRPDLKITLCESMAKKARSLETMVRELDLDCKVRHLRAEALLANERFDVAIARAVGPLWKMCFWLQNRWNAIEQLLALKGSRWEEELIEARRHPSFRQVHARMIAEYPMPGTDSLAYVISLSAKGAPQT